MDDGNLTSSANTAPNAFDEPPDAPVKYRSERERAVIAAGPLVPTFEDHDEDDDSFEADDEDADAFHPNAHLERRRQPTPPPECVTSEQFSALSIEPQSPARRPRLSSFLAQPPTSFSLQISIAHAESPHAQPSFLNAGSALPPSADPVLAAASLVHFDDQTTRKELQSVSTVPLEHPRDTGIVLSSVSSSAALPSQDTSPDVSPNSPDEEPADVDYSAENIQALIRAVSRDSTLSEAEKNRKRQAILSHQFQQRRKREAQAFIQEMNAKWDSISYSNIIDVSTGKKMPGCEHYPRNCKIRAKCCGVWVVCRLCHDHPSMDHPIDRFATEEIMCMLCKRVQPVAKNCIECNVEFARYFCEKCKFYDNTPDKDIYHCDKCKICRVGKGIGHDNFHCDNCDACVSLEYSKNHRCLKKSLDANCPICGQYLFTSTQPVVFMRCGHTMHSHCFNVYTAEHFICPLCHKALTNMTPYYEKIDEAVKREEMPPEHKDKVSEVLCHDCDERSVTPFHFLYHKCMKPQCGSYNTRVIRTYKKDSGPGESSTRGPAKEESQYQDMDTECRDGVFTNIDVDMVSDSESDTDSPMEEGG